MNTYTMLEERKADTTHREPVEIPRHSQSCPRCQGFIIRENFCDTKDSCSPLWIVGVRCTNCGFIGDALVLHHRMMEPSHESFPQPRRRRGFHRLDPIRKGSIQRERVGELRSKD